MKILRMIRLAVLAMVLLVGVTVLAYLGLGAYRDDLTVEFRRYVGMFLTNETERFAIRIGDGVSVEEPGKLARQLGEVARLDPYRIDLEVIPTQGAADALAKVARGELDVAFVQGGFRPSTSQGVAGVDLAAALVTTPLHLLISNDLSIVQLTDLRNERVWLDSEGSGTRSLAEKVLDFADKNLSKHVCHDERPIEKLLVGDRKDRPKAIFLASTFPSRFAEDLIDRYGYRLQPLPMARGLALRHFGVQQTEIPEYTYGRQMGTSVAPTRTVGTRILLVVSTDQSGLRNTAIRRKHRAILSLLASIYEGDFARRANLPDLDENEIDRSPEYPIHPASRAFRNRHQSLFTGENVQSMEALANLGFGALVLLFFPARLLGRALGRWRFDALLREADRLGRDIARSAGKCRSTAGPPARIASLGERLRELNRRVTRDYASGRLRKREQFDRLSTYVENLRGELLELRATKDQAAAKTTGEH